MSYELKPKQPIRQTATSELSEVTAPCPTMGTGPLPGTSPLPLCLARNANVSPLAYGPLPTFPAVASPVAISYSPTKPWIGSPLGMSSLDRGMIKVPPQDALGSRRPASNDDAAFDDYSATPGLETGSSEEDFIADLMSRIRDLVDRSGLLIAPQCNVTMPQGNAGIMLVFEVTPKNPETGSRDLIGTSLTGGSVSGPVFGGGSYRHADSTDSTREGDNWSFQNMVRTRHRDPSKQEAYGWGIGRSTVQNETFNVWRHNHAGFNANEELVRVDFMEPVSKLIPALYELRAVQAVSAIPMVQTFEQRYRFGIKCGGAFMIRSPALRYFPLFRTIGRGIKGFLRMEDRITNNRAQHDHEANLLDVLATMFLHQNQTKDDK